MEGFQTVKYKSKNRIKNRLQPVVGDQSNIERDKNVLIGYTTIGLKF